jgi:hypothetical protein
VEYVTGLLFDPKYGSFLQTIAIAILTALAARYLAPKGKLIWGLSHQHFYQMPRIEGGNFPVRTQQIWFQNMGRAAIEDIEVVLNYPPQHYEVWDPRSFETLLLADKRLVLKFPSLYPREGFTLSMIDTISDIPQILHVRSKSGVGKAIEMRPQQVWPTWVLYVIWILIFVGVSALLRFLLLLIL